MNFFNGQLLGIKNKGITIGSTTYDSSGNVIDRTGINKFFYELGKGVENWWYGITGQTEKTTAYQAQIAREDSAYQRAAEDMSAAGLSKFQGISGASTGSYGDGVPKGLQYVAALMDLKAKQAGIRKINAEADNIDANTEGQKNTNRTFDETHAAQLAQMWSSASFNEANKKLTEIRGSFEAEKITAEIQQMTSTTALNEARRLAQEISNTWLDEDYRSQIDSRDKTTQLNNQRIQNLREELLLTTRQIALSISQQNHLDKQSAYIVAQTTYQSLLSEVLAYNYTYSQEQGLRTTDSISRFMGINLGVDGTIKTVTDWVKNWKGLFGDALGLPSWNDIFGGQ